MGTLLRPDNFYVKSAAFSSLSLLGAFISYALYPALARIITPSEFGDFTSVVAMSNQILGILMAFNIISIYLVKKYGEEESREKTRLILKVLLWIFMVLSIFFLVFSPLVRNLLQIKQLSSFVVLGLILVVSIPATVWTGYIQGHKELIRIGIYSLVVAVGKFIGVILLAALFGLNGGMVGFLAGTLLGLLVLRLLPGVKTPPLSNLFSPLKKEQLSFLVSIKAYIAQAVFVVGTLAVLQNIDIVYAKVLFRPETAGLYGGVSIISNMVYYVLFLLIWITLPEIDLNNKKATKRALLTSYKLIALATLIVLAGIKAFGNIIPILLLGPEFGDQSGILLYAALYQITLVSIALYALSLLVLRSPGSVALTLLVLPGVVITPMLSSTPFVMIRSLWLSLFAGVCVYYLYNIILRAAIHVKK